MNRRSIWMLAASVTLAVAAPAYAGDSDAKPASTAETSEHGMPQGMMDDCHGRDGKRMEMMREHRKQMDAMHAVATELKKATTDQQRIALLQRYVELMDAQAQRHARMMDKMMDKHGHGGDDAAPAHEHEHEHEHEH